MADRGTTAQRDRDRQRIARAKPACHICGEAIQYDLPVAQHAVSEPASATAELDRLRAAVRKVHTQIEDSSRLTPVEFDALRRAIDPSFTRAKKKRNKGR